MNTCKSLPRRLLPGRVGAAVLVLSCGTACATTRPGSPRSRSTGSATVRAHGARRARDGVSPDIRLPANFDPRSVRVDADPGVSIGEVSTRDFARTEATSSREGAARGKDPGAQGPPGRARRRVEVRADGERVSSRGLGARARSRRPNSRRQVARRRRRSHPQGSGESLARVSAPGPEARDSAGASPRSSATSRN